MIEEQSEYYIDSYGSKLYYLPSKGKEFYNRLDGPATEHSNGSKEWYVNGKRHRLDGPAIEYADGSKQWYVDDQELQTEEIEEWLEENNINLSTEEGKMGFKLRWL